MKYYKTENGFGVQPNNILPSNSVEITKAEYINRKNMFDEKQKMLADYVAKVRNGEITLEEVPGDYFIEVKEIVNAPEPEQLYTLDEASEIISQEVSK